MLVYRDGLLFHSGNYFQALTMNLNIANFDNLYSE